MLILLNTNINFICFDVLSFLHNNIHKKNIQSVNIYIYIYLQCYYNIVYNILYSDRIE